MLDSIILKVTFFFCFICVLYSRPSSPFMESFKQPHSILYTHRRVAEVELMEIRKLVLFIMVTSSLWYFQVMLDMW